jgi:GST-like protein
MLKFYYNVAPNPMKVGLLLEELGLPYDAVPVDTRKGEQHKPEFLAINPNAKAPAITDDGGPVFDSNAILLYLAEKTGKFLPTSTKGKYEALQWLMWQMGGVGPMFGQAHHFLRAAPEQVPYGIKRYTDEVNRLYGVLERALAEGEWIAGDYSIADMAVYPWLMHHDKQGQQLEDFPNIHRWYQAMGARPGVQRGVAHEHELGLVLVVGRRLLQVLGVLAHGVDEPLDDAPHVLGVELQLRRTRRRRDDLRADDDVRVGVEPGLGVIVAKRHNDFLDLDVSGLDRVSVELGVRCDADVECERRYDRVTPC